MLPFWSFAQSIIDGEQDDLLGKGYWTAGGGLGTVTNIYATHSVLSGRWLGVTGRSTVHQNGA